MILDHFYKIGYPDFMGNGAVLSALFKRAKTDKSTFTDHSRNKFGVNDEILIY
jgi:hypothetical protein